MILLLDTSTPICRLTLVVDDVRHEYEWQADRTLADKLLGYLQDRLREHQGELRDITGIGVMSGPGSFTGLRIGLTVLNTIADTLHVPIVGVKGDDWRNEALQRLTDDEDDRIVMPEYGGVANITAPRK